MQGGGGYLPGHAGGPLRGRGGGGGGGLISPPAHTGYWGRGQGSSADREPTGHHGMGTLHHVLCMSVYMHVHACKASVDM